MSEVKVSKVRLDSLIPDDSNANKGTIRGTKALENSIQQFGFIEAGTLDKNNRIMGGNKRAEAVAAINLSDEVIIVETDGSKPIYLKTPYDLDTPEGRKIAYALNRIHELNFELDPAQLVIDLESGLDLLDLWNPDELSVMLEGAADSLLGGDGVKDVEPQIDKAAELKEKWSTALGQVWQLGEHRIVCGDCTDAAVVEMAMRGERADQYVTDPPYGVSYADKNEFLNAISPGNRIQVPIENDHLSPDEIKEVWRGAFKNAYDFTTNQASFYLFMPQGGDQMMMMMMMMMSECWIPRHELIWLKNNHVLGQADYAYKHEPILYGWKRDGTHKYYGGFQTSILEYDKPQKSDLHPTTKPLPLLVKLVENNTKRGEIVLDTFLGSGTTVLACDQLKRKARGIEIDPGYLAVTIQRWADLTARDPIRLSE